MGNRFVVYEVIEEEPALGCGGALILLLILHVLLRFIFGISLFGWLWDLARGMLASIF